MTETAQMMQSLQSKTEIIFIDVTLNESYFRRSKEFCNKLGYSTMIRKVFFNENEKKLGFLEQVSFEIQNKLFHTPDTKSKSSNYRTSSQHIFIF